MGYSSFASRYRQQPKRGGAFRDLAGAHHGFGLEVDGDRAARGQVDGRDAEASILADGELDPDGTASGKLLWKVERRQADLLAVVHLGTVALAGHDTDVYRGLVGGVGAEIGGPLHGDLAVA